MRRRIKPVVILVAAAFAALSIHACDDGQSPDGGIFLLSVVVDGNGRGAITSDPGGIDCSHEGGTCEAEFDAAAEVTLSVVPGLRTTFTGWGQACSGMGPCTITMDGAKTVRVGLDNPHMAAEVIGAEGGSITSTDSLLTLDFPAGALPADTPITIEVIGADELASLWDGVIEDTAASVYELGAAGLAFAVPVDVTLRSRHGLEPVDDSTSGVALEWLRTASDTVEVLDSLRIEVDPAAGTVTVRGRIHHFSNLVRSRDDAVDLGAQLRDAGRVRAPFHNRYLLRISPGANVQSARYYAGAAGVLSLNSASTGTFDLSTFAREVELEYVCDEVGAGEARVDVAVMVDGREVTFTIDGPVECRPFQPYMWVGEAYGDPYGTFDVSPRTNTPEPGTLVTLTAIPNEDAYTDGWVNRTNLPNIFPATYAGCVSPEPQVQFVMPDHDISCWAGFGLYEALEELGKVLLDEVIEATTVVEDSEEISNAAGSPPGDAAVRGSPGDAARAARSGAYTTLHMATIEATSGDLHLYDITDPAAPVEIHTEPGFCPGANFVFYNPAPSLGGPYFEAMSLSERKQCILGIYSDGFSGYQNTWTYAPGEKAVVPGTEIQVDVYFENGQIDFYDPVTFGGGAPIYLSNGSISGGERTCPFAIEATPNRVFVVGREGVAGTTTENCNNWRKVFIVDISGWPTKTVSAALDVGEMPRDVAVDADGTRAYVSDYANDEVYVIDAVAGTVLRTIPTGDGPTGLALSPDGATLFVANWNAGSVQAIDVATDETLFEHTTGFEQPVRVHLTSDGTGVIVTHWGGDAGEGAVVVYTYTPPGE